MAGSGALLDSTAGGGSGTESFGTGDFFGGEGGIVSERLAAGGTYCTKLLIGVLPEETGGQAVALLGRPMSDEVSGAYASALATGRGDLLLDLLRDDAEDRGVKPIEAGLRGVGEAASKICLVCRFALDWA